MFDTDNMHCVLGTENTFCVTGTDNTGLFSMTVTNHTFYTIDTDNVFCKTGTENVIFWALNIYFLIGSDNICHMICTQKIYFVSLISSFRRVLYVVRFLLGNTPASGTYMPTFRNTLSVPSL